AFKKDIASFKKKFKPNAESLQLNARAKLKAESKGKAESKKLKA
ncbi:MAG: hypothetical protein JWQ78_1148, partial [Sediminibacterium sp.]|nr:hypothetical protein [Sediminibacterium sp.]